MADVFDALSNKRPYKAAFPLEQCFTMIEEGRGTHFDPRVLDAFFARRSEILRVRREYTETASAAPFVELPILPELARMV